MNRLFERTRDKLSAKKQDALAASNPYRDDAFLAPAAPLGPPPPYAPPYAATAPRACEYTRAKLAGDGDAYNFLYLFDTVFLIDDSSSMLGRRWSEVQAALGQLAPVCTSHDDDGTDVYFMNHRSPGPAPEGKAASGYYGVTDAAAVEALFTAVRPYGPTPTRSRLCDILDPYFALLRAAQADVKPLNLVVITDGMPGPPGPDGSNPHLPEPALVDYAAQLDALAAPAYQVGVQFIQVGNDAAATRALKALDTLRKRFRIRDMVDTIKYDAAAGPLTADAILKAVLGGVDRRLDNDSE